MRQHTQAARPAEPTLGTALPWRIHRLSEGADRVEDGKVVAEEPLEIRIDGRPVAVLMRTPGQEKELAVGYCLAEGLIADPQDIALVHHCGRGEVETAGQVDRLGDSRNRVDLILAPEQSGNAAPEGVLRMVRSGCGRTDVSALVEGLRPLPDGVRIAREVLTHVPAQLARRQAAYRAVGGIHAAGVLEAGGPAVVVCEDIGRHNAVDKALGHCLLWGIPLDDKVLVSTGRASYDLVVKGVRLGIPILASLSSPTSLAVELAQALNCTLLGYLRGKTLSAYTHAWRISTQE